MREPIGAAGLAGERGEALRRSEELYRGLFESAHDAILIFDPQSHRIIAANPSASAMYGFDDGALVGRSMSELAANVEEGRRKIRETLRSNGRVHFETVHRRSDGTELIVDIRASVIEYDGRPVVLSINRDVTERRRADERLRESEARLTEAQRIANMATFVFDCDKRIAVSSDEHFIRMFGRGDVSDGITYEHFLSLLDAEARTRVEDANRRLLRDGTAEWQMTVPTASGTERHVRCVARADRSAKTGRIVRTIAIVQDITEQAEAAERLRTSEERFRLIAQAANDVLWDWDLRGDWLWWSSGYTTLFGHARDERGGAAYAVWESLVHPDDYQRVRSGIDRALASGATEWSSEYRFRRADGTYVLVRDSAFIVRGEGGRPVRFVGAVTDITEERRLAEQLERAQRVDSLGRIAASIAHEFNNVLMGIQPHVEVLRRRKDPETVATSIEHIGKSVRRGKRVTDDILQFTRSVAPALADVEVAELIESWRGDVAPAIGEAVDLQIDSTAVRGVYIRADALKLAQVLTNLAVNAKEAMPLGGTLRVDASVVDERVHIAVADDGSGMTAEQLARAFEPLYTTKRGGTGLGLPISFQIVAAHGGQITANSEPGRGTTFDVILPVANIAAAHVPHRESDVGQLRRVLLVEDEVAVAVGLQWLLETEGVSVDMVHTGREAVGRIEANVPDAVILDVGLPDISGTEVFAAIRRRWPDLPVLFSSGHAGAETLGALLDTKHTALLLKPYELPSLCAALQQVIRG